MHSRVAATPLSRYNTILLANFFQDTFNGCFPQAFDRSYLGTMPYRSHARQCQFGRGDAGALVISNSGLSRSSSLRGDFHRPHDLYCSGPLYAPGTSAIGSAPTHINSTFRHHTSVHRRTGLTKCRCPGVGQSDAAGDPSSSPRSEPDRDKIPDQPRSTEYQASLPRFQYTAVLWTVDDSA